MDQQTATPKSPALLSVIQTAYYQCMTDEPMAVEGRFGRRLTSDEQLYLRKLKVGTTWQWLDPGWLTGASLLVVTNDEGRYFQVNPTPDERQAVAARVIEVACFPENTPVESLVGGWLVRPGESIPAEPAYFRGVWLRCRSEQAKCTVAMFPT